jgi:hypothetical protein
MQAVTTSGLDIAKSVFQLSFPSLGLMLLVLHHSPTPCDASDLRDLRDKSFDLVVSIFGAMFTPKPFDVAKEMVRVTRPGGRIIMGNWTPERPDFGRTNIEGQRGLHSTAT